MIEEILTVTHSGIAQICINRPDKKNALTSAMYAALAKAIDEAETDPLVRVIVLFGSADVFTAGNDLLEFLEGTDLGSDRPVQQFMQSLAGAQKVVIAGVSGLAVGIGTTMLFHCDLVVAGRNARFSLPFINLGLVPEFGNSLLFPNLVGRQRASKHLLLGQPFDANTAASYGFVSEVVDDADVVSTALDWASQLVAKPPRALLETKRLMAPEASILRDQIARESSIFSAQLSSPECSEALNAFLEKRPSSFPLPLP